MLNPKHAVIAFKCRGRICFLHGLCLLHRKPVIVFLAPTCCVCVHSQTLLCVVSIRVCKRGCNYTQIQYITVGRFSGGFVSTKLLLTPPPSILFNMTDVFIHFRDKLDTMHPWCWHKWKLWLKLTHWVLTVCETLLCVLSSLHTGVVCSWQSLCITFCTYCGDRGEFYRLWSCV